MSALTFIRTPLTLRMMKDIDIHDVKMANGLGGVNYMIM